MSTITLDFRYAYNQGERRTADPTAYQWDKGHTLDIIVPTAVQSAELHYHKSGDDKAKPFAPNSIEGNTVHANIPNSLFEDSRNIIVYLVVTDDEMYRTEYEGVIDIRARPKPYDYTEDNAENGAQTISGLYVEAKEAVAKAGEAKTSAAEAKTSEGNAASSAASASKSAEQASTSAVQASDSAEQAASSASEAKASADSVKASADTIQTNSDDIRNLKNQIDALYPVGSIYLSVNDTNPSTFIGGTWERIKDRFLLAAGNTYAAGSTGGEATHTLTLNEMPSHRHSITLYASKDGLSGTTLQDAEQGKPLAARQYELNDLSSEKNIEQHINCTGGGAAHNNMPPYLAVYMWKRTA